MNKNIITRRLKNNPKIRSKVRKSPLMIAAISENLGSTDQNVSDMSKAKRVKFTLPELTQPPRTDAPKTSEYAFFKKLREDIGGYSRPTDQLKTAKANDRITETFTPSNLFNYADRNLRSSLQSEREKPTGQFSFLSPPIHAEPDNVYGKDRRGEFKGIKQRSSLAYANVTPDGKNLVMSPFASVSNQSGNQCAGKGIFSRKRHKLRQLVANTFPVVGECSSKGFDLIPTLLSRLFPNGNVNQYSNSKERVLNTTYQFAAVPGSNAEEEIHARNTTEFKYTSCWNDDFPKYWSSSPREICLSKRDVTTSTVPLIEYNAETDFQYEDANLNRGFNGKVRKENFRARDSSSYLSSDNYESVSSGHLKELDGFHNSNEPARREPHALLLQDVTTSTVPLIEYNAETDFQYEYANLNRGFNGKVRKENFRARDSSSYLSSDNYASVSSGYLKELDGFHNSNEPARREPHALLLSWDVDEEKEQNFCSALATSSEVSYQQILDESLQAINMNNTSFLCSNHNQDFNYFPYAHSTGSRWHDIGRNYEDDCAVVAASQFRSFNPQYFTMADDCDTCNILEKNNVSLHCYYHPWFTSKESGRKGHFEALLFSGELNDDLEWKFLPSGEFSGEDYSSNSHVCHFPFKEDISSFTFEESSLYCPKHRKTTVTFSDGAFDLPNWFSSKLEMSLNKLLGNSLLLDNSGRVRSEKEIHFDDDDNQWKSS